MAHCARSASRVLIVSPLPAPLWHSHHSVRSLLFVPRTTFSRTPGDRRHDPARGVGRWSSRHSALAPVAYRRLASPKSSRGDVSAVIGLRVSGGWLLRL